jgi:hypothetical protein|tara:strand:- start:7978 stop:8142 length:165 start_codon:yes stop_codon:yes gene_type:complete
MKHPFTDEELTVIFEAANLSIADAEIFDYIADKLDISDDEMKRISDKLYDFMNP